MDDVEHYCPRRVLAQGQNPRRHPRVPRMYTYKEFQESKKCVGSMGNFLDLMKLGAHGGLG